MPLLMRKTWPSGWRTCISRTFHGMSVGGKVIPTPQPRTLCGPRRRRPPRIRPSENAFTLIGCVSSSGGSAGAGSTARVMPAECRTLGSKTSDAGLSLGQFDGRGCLGELRRARLAAACVRAPSELLPQQPNRTVSRKKQGHGGPDASRDAQVGGERDIWTRGGSISRYSPSTWNAVPSAARLR